MTILNRFKQIYVEIGNVCNLQCSFCPEVERKKAQMSAADFATVLDKVQDHTDSIYLHLMGEPLYGPLDREKRSRIVASRRIGTRRLIEALGRTRVHLVVASSAAVYGYGEGPPITETTAIQPPKDRLALALLGCEEEADRLRENGSTVTLVRLGPVIAPGGFPELLRDLFDRRITWRSAHGTASGSNGESSRPSPASATSVTVSGSSAAASACRSASREEPPTWSVIASASGESASPAP